MTSNLTSTGAIATQAGVPHARILEVATTLNVQATLTETTCATSTRRPSSESKTKCARPGVRAGPSGSR
jgi:hypothetical protein